MGTRPVQAHVGPASSSALSAPLLSHPVTHHAHRSVLVQTASLRLPTVQRAQQGCAELPLKSPCRRIPTWQRLTGACCSSHRQTQLQGEALVGQLVSRHTTANCSQGSPLPPTEDAATPAPTGRGRVSLPPARGTGSAGLPAGPPAHHPRRGMKRREMDRVCCVQTLSRHRDGGGGAGRGGGTQPHSREGKGADSGWRQWQGAHTGGQRGRRRGVNHPLSSWRHAR